MLFRRGRIVGLLLAFSGLAACLSNEGGSGPTGQLAGFDARYIETAHFDLYSLARFGQGSSILRIYIEGDGMAWISRSRLSSDPTPRGTLVRSLVAQDPASSVAYLARPCQYSLKAGRGRGCRSDYWSQARFAPEVVASMNEAVSALKHRSGAERVELVGYSGGGAIAVLIAARRDDVASVRTLAGNLDHDAVNAAHGVSPLTQSLNALDVSERIVSVPQVHFIGGKDEIIPEKIVRNFLVRQGAAVRCARVEQVPAASHHDGWEEGWPDLLSIRPRCD